MTPIPDPESPRESLGAPRPRWVRRLALVTAALMAAASAAGLGLEGLYRDNALVAASWKGNDLVTLLLAAPLLAAAALRAGRESPRARMVTLGMLLYAFYAYAFYLFGAAFNALFLVYVAIVGASGVGLLLGLMEADGSRLAKPAPAGVGGFMVVVGVVLGVFWVTTSAAFLFTGAPPALVAATNHPTNVTGALDLALVVPPALIGGLWLRRGRPWGYLLAVIWNVKAAVYMPALIGASVSAWLSTPDGSLVQVLLWAPIGAGALISAATLLRAGPATDADTPEKSPVSQAF